MHIWWRDDDAMRATRQLRRLLELSGRHRAPLTLAVVPLRFEDSLVRALENAPARVTVCAHGADHRNRAAPGEPASEFPPDRDPTEALAAIAEGRRRLADAFGERALDILAPPWNRIAPGIRDRLAEVGIESVSDAGSVHIDPVAWSTPRSVTGRLRHRLGDEPAPRSFVGVDGIISQVSDAPEVAGLMTHHRVHNRTTWVWLNGFLTAFAGRFLDVREYLERAA